MCIMQMDQFELLKKKLCCTNFHIFYKFTDMNNGLIADMVEMGITESFQVKRQVLMSAAEAAEMILRVDNIVKSAPRQRMPDHCM